MKPTALVGALMVVAALTAGCVGQFEVKQTEPLRIQIDGGSQQGRVVSADSCDDPCSESDTREFEIETTEAERVTVVVQVTKVASGQSSTTTTTANGDDEGSDPCKVLVIVKDRSSGAKLEEKTVTLTDDDSVEATLDVDVKGKNNIVVITQAIEGTADVDVSAQTMSSSHGDQSMGTSAPSSTTASATTSTSSSSTSPPASTSPTSTTGP